MNPGDLACNVCGESGREMLRTDGVPPLQNRFYASLPDARNATTADCSFVWCDNCTHISVRKTHTAGFDKNYNNSQTASPVAVGHLAAVVEDIRKRVPAAGAHIVEIGCGRGELLEMLQASGYLDLAGYDPAAPATTELVRNAYWNGVASGERRSDLLIARHTLEEVPSPLEFVGALSDSLVPGGYLYCEITNACHLLNAENLFSLYPECANLFSMHSISRIFAGKGIYVEDVVSQNGGELLGVWGRKSAVLDRAGNARRLNDIANRIKALPRPVVLWGAGGKGGNILAFLKLDRTLIEHVIDLSPAKQGTYMPPYGQEIVAPGKLGSIAPKTILVANRIYAHEILQMAPEGCKVVTIDDLTNNCMW